MALVAPAAAEDWPQWMGPGRDNVWRESGIVDKFPEGGPKILWSAPVAGGYAGPGVAAGRVVITDYVTADDVKVANFERKQFSGVERVLCLDEATGREVWKHEYPVQYTMSYPSGPRCTPILHAGKVYTLGGEGNLICFDLGRGEVIWQKDLVREYNTKTALWGYASHPLIDGQKLICLVGGEGSHVVAFDKDTGAGAVAHVDCHRTRLFAADHHPGGRPTTADSVAPRRRHFRRSRNRQRVLVGSLRSDQRVDHHVADPGR